MRFRFVPLLILPIVLLSSCFWNDNTPNEDDSGSVPLANQSGDTSSGSTASGVSMSGSEIRPLQAYKTSSGVLIHFSDDRRVILSRTGVVALESGFKIVWNGEVVGDDGNQIGYMAAGDIINIDDQGTIDWQKAGSGTTATGSTRSGSIGTGTTGSGNASVPMLDPAIRDMGPDSDDSAR